MHTASVPRVADDTLQEILDDVRQEPCDQVGTSNSTSELSGYQHHLINVILGTSGKLTDPFQCMASDAVVAIVAPR